MILRRVIAHFRKQEWTAIAIDFLIVVVGVFVGIQVSNWNAARIDRARADGYLERLAGDLGADVATYQDRMNFWRDVSRYGAAGIKFAESGDADGLTQWQLLLAYFQSSQVAEFYTTETTYEELKSAGELGLITDPAVRDALAIYYINSDNPALSERPPYREQVRGVIPLEIQTYIWTECYSSADGRQVMRDCPSPVDDARASELVRAIASDEGLIRELRYWMSTMHIATIIGRDRVDSGNALRALIDGALKRSAP